MSSVYHLLSGGSLVQDWANAGQITSNDDWSGVPSIQGFLGDIDAGSSTGVDPRSLTGAATGVLDVIANQTATTITNGGVAEFALADPTVALQGSGTADAPGLVLYLDATGRQDVRLQFNARDIDLNDDAVQPIAIQYRLGDSAGWSNVTGGYQADVTTGGSASQVTPFDVTLPGDANGAAQIQLRILTTNAPGSDEWVGIDDISVSSAPLSGGATTVSIADAAITEGDSGTSVLTFTVSRTDNSGAFTVDYATADDTATAGSDYGAVADSLTFTAGGALTQDIAVTINGDSTVEPDETFTVTLGNIVDGSGTAVLGDASATGTITNDDVVVTPISAVQGSGSSSPLVGMTVTVDAIVVGDFQTGDADAARNLNGFYLQEEAADQDGDPLSSEGLFVFGGATDVHRGDRVQVTGIVSEYFGLTELTASTIRVVDAGAVPDVHAMAVAVNLPAAATTLSQDGDVQPDFEAYEGMLVTIPDTLTITEQFNLDRFNEIKLVAGGRPAQFTQENAPDQAGNAAYLQETGGRTITYDDGLNVQNAAIDSLDGFAGYDSASAPRMGDTITGLTGVLDYQWAGNSASGATWRVRAVNDGDNSFAEGAPRPASPADVGGTLTACSLNVLNFFTTLDDGATTAVGLEPRGANTSAEFARQAEKLVTVLTAIDADLFSLVELENDFQAGAPGNALEYICNQLNAALGGDIYDWVDPGQQFVGGDAIAPGFLYKTEALAIASGTSVETLGDGDLPGLGLSGLLTQSSVGGVFDGANTSRNALAVTFTERATGGAFTAVANHLKSKGGVGSGADADQGDGQGSWQQQRELAAEALATWLGTDPTGSGDGDFMLLGDFNAYFKEDVIGLLEAAGYTNLQAEHIADPYSYVFDGQTGALDYIFANDSLAAQVTGIAEWHINADEADALDYNLDFGRDPAIFDGTAPYRVSDHDPLILGLDLTEFTLPTPGDDVIVAGAGDDTIDAVAGNDLVHGGAGKDVLTGGAGHDQLYGEDGDDVFIVASARPQADGADRYDGGAGVDTIDISAATSRVVIALPDSGPARYGNDTIVDIENVIGGAAGDTLRGNALTNELRGNGGDDILVGKDGDDRLFGDAGADRLDGGAGADRLAGGTENDTLYGRFGDDVLDGGDGDDQLYGAQDDDQLNGNAGNDLMDGSSGDDVLDGGPGSDTLTGGQGLDSFVFTAFDATDSITDFHYRGRSVDEIVLHTDSFTGFSGGSVQDLVDGGYLDIQAGLGATILRVDLDGGADAFATFASLTGDFTGASVAARIVLADSLMV